MMEELKSLLELIGKLPNVGLAILAGYLFYKCFIVGSVYAVIRFCVDKIHDMIVTALKQRELRKTTPVEMVPMIEGMCVNGVADDFKVQLRRLIGKSYHGSTAYVHGSAVDWLRKAIDDRERNDEIEKANRSLDTKRPFVYTA